MNLRSPAAHYPDPAELSPGGTARRQFLKEAGTLTTGIAAMTQLQRVDGAEHQAVTPRQAAPGSSVRMTVNGHSHELYLDPRVTLLDALREHLHLTGTKKGCDRGQCGACTVLVNGRRINSCLTLALSHEGDEVTTVEGLGSPQALHAVQKAFVEQDAFQCGYCTPGQICSAVALIDEAHSGAVSAATPDVRSRKVSLTDEEIRERMSGNLCRCGAYAAIVAAVRDAANKA